MRVDAVLTEQGAEPLDLLLHGRQPLLDRLQANPQSRLRLFRRMAPPVGFEPTLPAPEADALSPELWGLSDAGKSTSESARRGHAPLPGAITSWQALASRT